MEGTLFRFRLLFLFLLFLFFLLLGCDSNAQNVERPRDRRPPPATIKRRPLIGPPKEPISVLDYDHTSVLDGGTRLPIVLAKSLDILFFFWFLFFSFFFFTSMEVTPLRRGRGAENSMTVATVVL